MSGMSSNFSVGEVFAVYTPPWGARTFKSPNEAAVLGMFSIRFRPFDASQSSQLRSLSTGKASPSQKITQGTPNSLRKCIWKGRFDLPPTQYKPSIKSDKDP